VHILLYTFAHGEEHPTEFPFAAYLVHIIIYTLICLACCNGLETSDQVDIESQYNFSKHTNLESE